jgi:uncharacterized repeat protein (TIGR03803 family)
MKVIFLLWLTISLVGLAYTPATSGAPRQVIGDGVPALARLRPIERLEATQHLEFTIGLALRNKESLSNSLAEIYDPSSPAYHQYLTPVQFAERFGPTRREYQAVIAWAKSKGFALRGTHPNRTLVDLEGPVRSIEEAFKVQMRVYRHPRESRTFYAPEGELSLDLSVRVLAVSGLDDFVLPRPMNLNTAFFDPIPYSIPYASGSGPNGAFIGNDFRAAYAPGVELHGAGQSVGLFELDGYYFSDILAYENLAALPPVPITNVLVNGFSGRPGVNNVEVALDIVMTISMAPGLSEVIVYEGTGSSANAVLNRMATDNLARQLSSSWGFGPQVDPIREQIFQQFAAQGQSFFQAAGDDGAWTGPIYPPSDDPFVTVVGGTSLQTTGPGGARMSETTWSGSGGGISTSYALPAWQNGLSTPANQGSATMRNIPDVAAVADTTIWLVANNGQQGRVGGTSAAAPLWAGFAALANELAAATSEPAIGFLNPALYALGSGAGYAAALHDIASGNNTNSASPTRFFAVSGYDLCTGWGTPAGSNSIAALLVPPDALRISPSVGFSVTGPVGGPFAPSLQSYSLTNSGTKSLNWALGTIPPWLNAWSVGGTLAPGGAGATLMLNITPAAGDLAAGLYTATLWFTNLNNHFAQSRPLTLSVVTPPMITSQPANQAVFEGATATFSLGTGSNAFLSYHWRYDNGIYLTNLVDGGHVVGSATGTLLISNASPADVGAYSVIISNAADSVLSSNAFLTIIPWRPIVTSASGNQTVLPGSSVTLSVTAVGSRPLLYRWLKDGAALTDSGNITGSTSPTLLLTGVSSADAGKYSTVVSNTLGMVTSPEIALTVLSVTAQGTAITSLYSFNGGTDGGHPNGLALATNGDFYGTTQVGGTTASGTLFRMTPAGALATVHSFLRDTDGANPRAALVPGPNGILYGTTYQAGTNGFGTVFSTTTAGLVSSIFSFDKPDGILPSAPVTPGVDRSLYGTTYEGGSNTSYGTVYRLTLDGTATNLHSFSGGEDGGLPYGGVVQDSDGNLYGTTYRGGRNDFGTIFRISTNGRLASLLSFSNSDGAFPYAGLALGSDGSFYGVTGYGGSSSNGTLFRMTSEGTLTRLRSFTGGEDGANPAATLLEASDGNFYGTTTTGGSYGKGTVFRLSPSGAFATVVQFHGLNGANPLAPLAQGTDGDLYGATWSGGANNQGVLFRLSSTSAPQITGEPASQLVYAGATVRLCVAVVGRPPLYYRWFRNGTNLADGGVVSGATTRVLSLTNVSLADTGSYAVCVSNTLGSVKSADAFLQVTSSMPVIVQQPTNQTAAPGANVNFKVKAEGNLPMSYGWQKDGTNLSGSGNISGVTASLLSITTATEANNGKYSVTVSNTLGSVTSAEAELLVIPASAAGTRMKTLRSFAGGSDGSKPNGLARGTDGNLYGTTQSGGTQLAGTFLRATTNGTVSTLAEFTSTNGIRPQGPLVPAPDGTLFGSAQYGGLYGAGTVFRMAPNGKPANVYSFTGATDGSEPVAGLSLGADGNFYGSTSSGGDYGYGNLFKMTPGGTLTTLHSFTNGVDGSSPTGPLLQTSDGTFWGMTPGGGVSSFGNIFRMTPAGAYVNVYSFQGGTDGYQPAGALIQAADGNLYGVTKFNKIAGYNFYGTIFRLATNGMLSTLYALNYGDGTYPAAGLVEGGDGNFYGTTFQGGPDDLGTIFRVSPAGMMTTLLAFDGFNSGAHPSSALVAGVDQALYGTTTEGGPGGHGTVFKLSFAPRILDSAADREVLAGENVTFTAAVFGTQPLAYQWQQNGTNLADGANISGSSTPTLTLHSVNPANAGTYTLVSTNFLGAATNVGPLLVVISPPVFQDVGQTNGTLVLTWSAIAGHSYQLQCKTNLSFGTWTKLGTAITATSSTIRTSDPIGTDSQRLYRVLLLD